jgi:hypothetical protein
MLSVGDCETLAQSYKDRASTVLRPHSKTLLPKDGDAFFLTLQLVPPLNPLLANIGKVATLLPERRKTKREDTELLSANDS